MTAEIEVKADIWRGVLLARARIFNGTRRITPKR